MRRGHKCVKWIGGVRTASTFPPPGMFTRSPSEIARIMARSDVSPLGLGSAIRMVQYFINRSGKNLSPERRKALELAKGILHKKMLASKKKRVRQSHTGKSA